MLCKLKRPSPQTPGTRHYRRQRACLWRTSCLPLPEVAPAPGEQIGAHGLVHLQKAEDVVENLVRDYSDTRCRVSYLHQPLWLCRRRGGLTHPAHWALAPCSFHFLLLALAVFVPERESSFPGPCLSETEHKQP